MHCRKTNKKTCQQQTYFTPESVKIKKVFSIDTGSTKVSRNFLNFALQTATETSVPQMTSCGLTSEEISLPGTKEPSDPGTPGWVDRTSGVAGAGLATLT